MNSKKHKYPWQVYLEHPLKRQPFCGGSLITNQHVITAAHCLYAAFGHTDSVPDYLSEPEYTLKEFIYKYPSFIRVSLGDQNWNDTEFKFVTVSKFLIHPKFTSIIAPFFLLYDVAILTLSEKIEFSNKVSPICLPSSDGDYAGEMATITGWGMVDVPFDEDKHQLVTNDSIGSQTFTFPKGYLPVELQVANSRIISNEECLDNWGKNNGPAYIPQVRNITDVDMCSMAPPAASCPGDSGGPVFITESARFVSNKIMMIGDLRKGLLFLKVENFFLGF